MSLKVEFSKSPLLIQVFTLIATAFFFFSSCSKSLKQEDAIAPQAKYVLHDMHYFMSKMDKLDTLTLKLKDTTLFNTGNDMVLVKFSDKVAELVKTSHFQIFNPKALPTDLKIDKLEVNVPSEWYQNGPLSYFSTKLPLSTDSIQIPYGSYSSDALSVKVPARSRIDINRNIQAYQISCSFSAVIENKTSGQTYNINGSWKGMLRYDDLHTILTEHPL